MRLAAGLSPDRMLDAASQFQGISALRCFNERLRDYSPDAVRAVATNTLRVAKNAAHFLVQAEAALGFPIEVIAGREEARPDLRGRCPHPAEPHRQQLVVDIGGGSTEFVIGKSFQPIALELVYMGCVSFSLRHFSRRAGGQRGLRDAELAALKKVRLSPMPIGRSAGRRRWGQWFGEGPCGHSRTQWSVWQGPSRTGLERLRALMLKAGNVNNLQLEGLRPDRLPVLTGGTIMWSVFEEFGLERT